MAIILPMLAYIIMAYVSKISVPGMVAILSAGEILSHKLIVRVINFLLCAAPAWALIMSGSMFAKSDKNQTRVGFILAFILIMYKLLYDYHQDALNSILAIVAAYCCSVYVINKPLELDNE